MSEGATPVILEHVFLYPLSRKCSRQSVVRLKSNGSVKMPAVSVFISRKAAMFGILTFRTLLPVLKDLQMKVNVCYIDVASIRYK
jgi:hypothetical protein